MIEFFSSLKKNLKQYWDFVAGLISAIMMVVSLAESWRENGSALIAAVFVLVWFGVTLASIFVIRRPKDRRMGFRASQNKKYFYSEKVRKVATGGIVLMLLIPVVSLVFMLLEKRNQTPSPMTGNINIVVADFGDEYALAQSLYEELKWELESLGLFELDIQFRREGPVQNEEEARQLAHRINATLVIWGRVENKEPTLLRTRFTILDPQDGGEIGGKFSTIPLSGTTSSQQIQNLKARSKIIVVFIKGLVHLFNEQYQKAIAEFIRAIKIVDEYQEGMGGADGVEDILYFYKARSLAASQDDTGALEAFQKSLELNPDYAWSYIGIGNIYYGRALKLDPPDNDLLNQALETYEQAVQVHNQGIYLPSPSSFVVAKAYVNIGNVYSLQAELSIRSGETFKAKNEIADAESAYQKALQKYKEYESIENINVSGRFPAKAHYGLGIVYELQGSVTDAAREFKQCQDEIALDGQVSASSLKELCEQRYMLMLTPAP